MKTVIERSDLIEAVQREDVTLCDLMEGLRTWGAKKHNQGYDVHEFTNLTEAVFEIGLNLRMVSRQ